MEVGAIKQAFNNEVIVLKKKLNQAKIHIIHKLTRKAKQLAEKKAPDPLKEKLKRKAQAAVNEVLIIKKIKPKDIAKFTVTHKGELKDFLNKPIVDNDKVCARLLLHKALQDKYEFIRERFSNVPIQDLFMSRLERRKMKKEAKEKQERKKKGKNSKVVNSEGDWNVEDVVDKTKLSERGNDDNELSDDGDHKLLSAGDSDDHALSDGDKEKSNGRDAKSNDLPSEEEGNNSEEEAEEFSSGEVENECNTNVENEDDESDDTKSGDVRSEAVEEVSNHKELPSRSKKSFEKCQKQQLSTKQTSNINPKEVIKKTLERKQKDMNKNKHFNEKNQQRKLKKDTGPDVANKIVDPFFITATGENYMSVVEPRGPDEVKAEHKQGNRKLRRAVMFGHVPNIKPRQNNNSYINDNRFSKKGYENGNKFNNWQEANNEKPFNNNFNDRKRFNDKGTDEKEEKLHPSWEAKKKKSGILPYEGKKIVFD